MYKPFYKHMFALDKCLEVEFWGSRVGVCLTLWETARTSQSSCDILHSIKQCMCVLVASHSL